MTSLGRNPPLDNSYMLTGQMVDIRATLTTVEIFHRGERVASHLRSDQPYKAKNREGN